MGKANPLNDKDMKEFIELQKDKKKIVKTLGV